MADMIKIDVIILSYAKDDGLKALTIQTIDTLLQSEDPEEIVFNVLVVESNKKLMPYQFANSITIYPDVAFGFNRYLNIGAKATCNPYICFCNNDLIFHKGWASEIILALKVNQQIDSASTYCPDTHAGSGFATNSEPVEGYENLFSGWCFMIKRSLLDRTGYFDEKFIFWYSDRDYLKTLKKLRLKNFLISKSLVTHLKSMSSNDLTKKETHELTLLPLLYFNYKWNRDSFIFYKLKCLYFYLKFKLNLFK